MTRGDPRIGTRIARGAYIIQSLIAEGGMASVYRGVQVSMDRPVALKVLRREWLNDITLVQRMQQEARLVGALSHPNTIRLYDFAVADDGALVIISELLAGDTLTGLLDAIGALTPVRAYRIVRQLLESLAEAHEAGITHRDVKPDNIFLHELRRRPDFVKVLDFGIATVGDTESRLTRPGTIVGTPQYLSPEHARGGPVDARSDLYSVGIVLYEMLTDRVPFDGDGSGEILQAHCQDPVPPMRRFGVDVPNGLERVARWCLEKSPERRPQSADQLIAALDQVMRGALSSAMLKRAQDGR